MSTAYYIALNNETEFDATVDGKSVAQAADDLIILCEENNLKILEDYLSQDPSEFLDDFDDLGLSEDLANQWFDAQEGIDYFESLIKLIQSNNTPFSKEEVIADLESYIAVLRQAKMAGCQWQLQIDI